MGRNLNALLGSAVKERRERSDERPADAVEPSRAEPSRVDPSRSELSRVPSPPTARTGTVAPIDARAPSDPTVTGDVSGAAASEADLEGRAEAPGVRPSDATAPPVDPPAGFPVGIAPADVSADGSEPAAGTPGASSPDPDTTPASATRPTLAVAPAAASGTSPGNVIASSSDAASAGASVPVTDTADTDTAASGTLPGVARVGRDVDVDDLPVAPGDPPRPGDRLRMIGVERIRRGVFQPRRFFDQEALQELADSLKAQGMIQPVIVRPFGGAFELIAGERRWRAAQIAGLAEIPAIVREMEDRTVAAVSLIENIQREDLNPLEEAQALTRLCDEFGMTHASVAESIGRSRASVSNLMRLLDLHDEVKVLVDKGELDMGHARALLRVPKVDQPALAARVAKQGLTVRAVEKLIRTGMDKGTDAGSAAAAEVDPDVRRLEERLSGVLGAQVSIRQKSGGAGRLEIRYTSLDELEGIL